MVKKAQHRPDLLERDHEVLVEESSGNVFVDLGLPDADELLAKAELARTIRTLIERQDLTQAEAARLLGTTRPKVSDLFRGRLDGFSMERLYRFLKHSARSGRDRSRPADLRGPADGGGHVPRAD